MSHEMKVPSKLNTVKYRSESARDEGLYQVNCKLMCSERVASNETHKTGERMNSRQSEAVRRSIGATSDIRAENPWIGERCALL